MILFFFSKIAEIRNEYSNQLDRERELREEFERERRILIAEREEERTSKQQLLFKYMDLEEKQDATGEHSVNKRSVNHFGDEEINTILLQSDRQEMFDSNLDRISIMMQCTELEQEMKKLLNENDEEIKKDKIHKRMKNFSQT
mgnify:CR=1 FL=1